MRTSTSFAMGAVVALVLGSGTAYAATGGNFVLGHANKAGTATALSNPNGTALSLHSKAGVPSLRVDRGALVPNLNADKLDGISSGGFARAVRIGTTLADGHVDKNGTTDTSDDSVVAIATCPTGSTVLGGGGWDYTDDGVMVYNGPADDTGRAWVVVSDTATLTAANAVDNVAAFARCYNAHRNVGDTTPGGARTAPVELSPLVRRAMQAAAHRR